MITYYSGKDYFQVVREVMDMTKEFIDFKISVICIKKSAAIDTC